MKTEELFSLDEANLLETLVLLAIENGNRDKGKAFNPTPEQYKTLCVLRKKIATMEINVENE